MNSEPVEDPAPRARGPRRAVPGEVVIDVGPAARGPRGVDPRRPYDRTAAARQSEEDFEGSWWLCVLICRLGDEVRRARGQHALEFGQELVVGEARFAAARSLDCRGRGTQGRAARGVDAGRGYD